MTQTQNKLLNEPILYLNAIEVEELGVFDFDLNRTLISQAFVEHYFQNVKIPKSDYLKYDNRPSYDRIITLLGYLGGEANISGVKIIGGSTSNATIGLPRASGLVMLHDPQTNLPLCILEGAQISAARTAAVSSIAIRKLAPPSVNKISFIGCGYLARTHMIMWKQLYNQDKPQIDVFDLNKEASKDLIKFAESLDLEIQIAESAKSAIMDADIIFPLTTSETPYIENSWIRKGSLYCAVSLLDAHLEVLENADKIIVDDEANCKHEGRPLQKLEQKGRLQLEKILSIGEVLYKDIIFHQNKKQTIFFNPMGLVIHDLALAHSIYNKALSKEIGTKLSR